MAHYRVTIGFWLRAYDGFDVEANSDAEAIVLAKIQALEAMVSTAHPEHIEIDERREGIICWIDAVGAPLDTATIAEDVAFDDDRIHPAGGGAPE